MMISFLDRVENIVGKDENAGYQPFLLFPQCFLKLSDSESLTLRIAGYKSKLNFPKSFFPWIHRHFVPPYNLISLFSSNQLTLFSSPEHKVLMVSFCDRPMSGVRRASSTIPLNIFSS